MNADTSNQSQRLFESGSICPEQENGLPTKVSRGMIILTSDGQEAGKVAAVVVDNDSQKVSHILLTRPRLVPEYRLVPLNLIEQVDEDTVLLEICGQAIESLPTAKYSTLFSLLRNNWQVTGRRCIIQANI